MSLFKYINIPVFIVSLSIGLFFVYMYESDRRVIYVYPNPDNVDSMQYKDAAGSCFAIKQTKTKCPKNESDISKIRAQS